MLTCLLYRAIGLNGYQPVANWVQKGVFKLRMRAPEDAVKCPGCGSRDVIKRGTLNRVVYAPPIGDYKTTVFIQVPRVECRKCQRVRTIKLPNVVPGKNHTKSFVRLVVDLRKMMTIQDIARYLGVSTTMIRGIDKQYLKTHFSKPKLKHVKLIAIDEICIGSGHKYVTIVMDLESGAIIFVGKGKGQDALKPFWRRLSSSNAKIEAAATDMSSAYYAAVQNTFRKRRWCLIDFTS